MSTYIRELLLFCVQLWIVGGIGYVIGSSRTHSKSTPKGD